MRALDEVVYRNEHLIELDTLQPPPEAEVRQALRAALGDSCVATSVWSDNDELTAVDETNEAEQHEKSVDRSEKEGLLAAEMQTRGGIWTVDAQTEKKYEEY